METVRKTVVFSLFFTFIVVCIHLFLNSERVLYSFSPQATVDPETISETFSPIGEAAFFNNNPVQVPVSLAVLDTEQNVLGDTAGNKRIEVDLTNQRLYAYEDDRRVFDFLVSTGKWGRTPVGTFTVWIKLRATKMEGGSKTLRTYYYLPNVPYVMFFANGDIPKYRGFGIHGTYWHNNFGHPMSHGCINMKTEEAKSLYQWAPNGIPVTIYGDAPAA